MNDDASTTHDEPGTDGATEAAVDCPGCGEAVTIDRSAGRAFRCPYCSTTFRPDGAVDDPDDDDGDAARDEADRRREEELDGVRIRALAAERRAADRQRSHVIVGAVAAAVVAGQLVWMTCAYVARAGWAPRPVGYVLLTAACAAVAVTLARKARRMAAEFERDRRAFTPIIPPGAAPDRPPAEPDFSTLGDGRDRWEKLNDVK